MIVLCLCSTAAGAGKTAHAVAVGKRLLHDGYRVEYLATVAADEGGDPEAARRQSAFVRDSLALGNACDPVFPVALSSALTGDAEMDTVPPAERLRLLRDRLANKVDVLLVETGGTPLEGILLGISAPEVVRLLDARPLVIAEYTGDLVVESILGAQQMLGVPLVGALVNGVPQGHLSQAQRTLGSVLGRRGIRVLGLVPEDLVLAAVTVDELASELRGRFLCCEDRSSELVEHLMVGAMESDHALTYFQRVPAKAVITGGDRPAIQLAALETATRCLVLTGNLAPSNYVLERAREVQVPLITVDLDTLSAVERSQRLFARARFRQGKKVQRLVDLYDRYFDYASLYSALGLAPKASRP